jgi:hypothetical protein
MKIKTTENYILNKSHGLSENMVLSIEEVKEVSKEDGAILLTYPGIYEITELLVDNLDELPNPKETKLTFKKDK